MKYILFFILLLVTKPSDAQAVRVGAKHFNEGYILSEIIAQFLEERGQPVERVYNLGGTLVCFEALRTHAIDLYPEYTGTISSEILKSAKSLTTDETRAALVSDYHMSITSSLGFVNSYGLVIRQETSEEKNITRISDLKSHAELPTGISYEFLKRQDGWENLSRHYGLTLRATGLEHGLAYEALRERKIDVTDAYTTDGEIARYHLTILDDDLHFFPEYQAVVLYHDGISKEIQSELKALEGQITATAMQQMNAEVLFDKKTFAAVARAFLEEKKLVTSKAVDAQPIWREIFAKTLTHMGMTFLALLMAIVVAVPLGIMLYWRPVLSTIVVSITGLLQTIPSIALLAVMIPLLGIGVLPAVVALFMYALLPIVQNTITGLQSVDPRLKDAADGIGMNRYQKLRWVELPLALPSLLAGIRTAAVINIGTATLAAFIGAGGLGEFIVTGLALNNTSLILRGAIPAALLAILVEFLFSRIEKRWGPKHLR